MPNSNKRYDCDVNADVLHDFFTALIKVYVTVYVNLLLCARYLMGCFCYTTSQRNMVYLDEEYSLLTLVTSI